MTLSELLEHLNNKAGVTPYPRLELTWNEHIARWESRIVYWRVQGNREPGTSGRTPQESVLKLVGSLNGVTLLRTGQNGSWWVFDVTEEVTCDDVALLEPKEPLPLKDGLCFVGREKALELARQAEKVYLQTYLGERPLKGYEEQRMIEPDRDGVGFRKLLECLEGASDSRPVEIGYYEGGKLLGFRGGLL